MCNITEKVVPYK